MTFTDTQAAAAATTASQDITQFTSALTEAGVTAVVTVSEADITVELMFTVTAVAAIDEPTPVLFESAVALVTGGSMTVRATISGFDVDYNRMPCSESDICDAGGNWQLVADAHTVACDGAECTVEERVKCCSVIASTGGARDTCVLGSLFSVLMWQFF